MAEAPTARALARQYGQWHAGLDPVPERITPENIERLGDFDFVFVSVDDGPARLHIVDWLPAEPRSPHDPLYAYLRLLRPGQGNTPSSSRSQG